MGSSVFSGASITGCQMSVVEFNGSDYSNTTVEGM
jgi:hypothetical protein